MHYTEWTPIQISQVLGCSLADAEEAYATMSDRDWRNYCARAHAFHCATPNARFWLYYKDDFVKVTLRPGHGFSYEENEATEEGYRNGYDWFVYQDGVVYREFFVRERDCDGLFDRGGNLACSRDQLRVRKPYGTDDASIRLPEWQDEKTWQRDHSAERAGY